jgi:peptidoglycan/LPS O-acetylase OafA/YrhL
MTQLRYRSDIDGLRAVAVLGVVIYHAFPKMIPGGFIGVDIFFVISGYLISGILYKGHLAGNFSFGEFYARRIRRLFPALLTMLVITLAYGWLILLPDEFRQLGKHAAAGTLFIQNFVFWQESGYFDTAASLKPLLHLWSLAVEEQFYILFPLLLIMLWKKPKFLVPVMGVLLIATFILNVVMSVQNSVSDFFLTPYRAWEFLGGSLLAWWHYDRGHEEVPRYREALSWAGFILLGLGFGLIHTGDPYPGWRALLPVAGTLLLMEGGAGNQGAWVNRRILSNPAVVWMGLISYPLYLFHWPALSFVHIVKGESPKPVYLIDALVIAFILTVLTYYFIEKKIRHNKSKWTLPTLGITFIIIGLLGILIVNEVIRPQSQSQQIIDIMQASGESYFTKTMNLSSPSEHVTLYQTGKGGEATLFVGDSNIEQYIPRIKSLLEKSDDVHRRAIFLTSGGVPPIPDIREKSHPGALELIPQMNRLLESDSGIDRVVIGANWVWYCSLPVYAYEIHGERFPSAKAKKEAFHALKEMIGRLHQDGKAVYVILNTPVGPVQDPKSDILRGFEGTSTTNVDPLTFHAFDELYGEFLSSLKLCAQESGATVIDPLHFFLTDKSYPRLINGKHIYKDSCHLRPSFVRDDVTYLDGTVRN